ncbi:MAG: DUF503 domain-containing protein [Acidobacteriota bacterium]
MIVGVAIADLHLPHARSLKQKRKVVRGLVDRIHARLRVSVAEVAHHDKHQRSEIAIATVAQNDTEAQRMLDAIRALFDDELEAVVSRWEPELLEFR